MSVIAEWSGEWPCLCYGTWTLIVNDEDVSDKIPDELRSSPMGTYGEYQSWHFDENWSEVFDSYIDGLQCDEWIEKNKDWLDKISTDHSLQTQIYSAISEADFRTGSCGGCI